jgi:lipoic acid synthetase
VRTLEQIGIELLESLGVTAERRKGFPGLWVQVRKIASIGVRVKRRISYHGMAINIGNDLGIFEMMQPCGLEGIRMTSVLEEIGRKVPMDEVKRRIIPIIARYFGAEEMQPDGAGRGRLPDWLRRPLPVAGRFGETESTLKKLNIDTICNDANCPNRGECWKRGTATVLILGRVCTRGCKFCSVAKGKPLPPDPSEPERIAEMAERMGLKYLVLTSVDRDDLPDGGAGHFRDCINAVRSHLPEMGFEILVPDFKGCQDEALVIFSEARPSVFAHNVETVPSLYLMARQGGDYQRSLELLRLAKQKWPEIPTKSSIMLGLGERDGEVEGVLADLRSVGCDRVTLGQYLRPSKDSLDVVEYVRPEKFDWWAGRAYEMGFTWVMSSAYTRSSYFAEQQSTAGPGQK